MEAVTHNMSLNELAPFDYQTVKEKPTQWQTVMMANSHTWICPPK